MWVLFGGGHYTTLWGSDPVLATLDELGIDGQRRGETFSIEEFAAYANALKKALPASE